jgi:tetratricopeptide (TPR) repeat protein
LFPEEGYVYENLANKLYALNQTDEALINYEKALAIDSNNKRVKDAIGIIKQKTDN